ncbi:MAG: mechanosensitive ion channel family protein [Nitrospirales bacterium]
MKKPITREAHAKAIELAARVEGVVSVKDEIRQERGIRQRLTIVQEKLWVHLNGVISQLPLFIIAIGILFLFWMFAKFMTKWNGFYQRLTANPFLQSLLKQTVRGFILFLGFLIALEVLDATAILGTILGVAGILGLAIGFAIRDTVENYIASILLSIRQPFQPNEHIIIENYEGLVMKLTTRDTILMTLDGNHVRIPNATVYKSIILNYSRNPNRRFIFEVGIDTAVNIEAARQLAVDTLTRAPGVLDDPPARCTVEKLGDSNVILKMFGWTDQSRYDFPKVKSEAIRAVKEAFDRADYEMPEPIYRLKVQGVSANDAISFLGPGTPQKNDLSVSVDYHEPSGDVDRDDHILDQISQEREDIQEPNLLTTTKEG